jgi:hypothetical protein
MSVIGNLFSDGTTLVAVGSRTPSNTSAILTSTDGITWTSPATQPALANSLLTTALKADGLWLAAGNGRTIQTSGSSSVTPPSFDTPPANASASTGGSATFTVAVSGSPAPQIKWQRNFIDLSDGPLASGAVVAGATTTTLTITGLTLAEAGTFTAVATNSVSAVNSVPAILSVNASANGAVLTPYGTANSGGGTLIPGANPPAAVTSLNNASIFTVGSGLRYLPNTFVNPVNYTQLGGTNPSVTRILLGPSSGSAPLGVYDIAAETLTLLPAPALPLGPIASLSGNLPADLAENGDVTGIFQTSLPVSPFIQNYGYHYSAATQTYTILGNVPNPGNDIASNPGGISADGTTIAGYERTGLFNGPFVWTTGGGFTLLPDPPNGYGNGDVRAISPNGRFITGFGNVHPALGSGQAAIRWDRGSPPGTPTGNSLLLRTSDSFGDGRDVTNDGVVVGNVRQGGQFTDNRAAVWLADGKLIVIPDYLAATYGLTTPGFILNQITSISDDLRVLAGTATNAANQSEGFILTLPAPLEISGPPQLGVRFFSAERVSGQTLTLGARDIGASGFSQQTAYVRNLGLSPLTGLSYAISGPDAADFSLATSPDPAPESLGINQFTSLLPRFSPQAGSPGVRSAVLTITHGSPIPATFTINLSATANAAPADTFANWPLLATLPADRRGPLDDPDGDRLPNLIEFVLTSHPGTFSPSPLAQGSTEVAGLTYPTLTFTRKEALAGVSLTVEIGGDLTFGSLIPAALVSSVNHGNGTLTVTLRSTVPSSDLPGQFLRLRAETTP